MNGLIAGISRLMVVWETLTFRDQLFGGSKGRRSVRGLAAIAFDLFRDSKGLLCCR
ncbi:MAG: hypothetical protein ACSHYB_17020 [Roseibacillus sp.]